MTRLARIESLKNRHFRIDQKIVTERGRPRPDERVLMCLKLQKLRLKEEIEKMTA
ncbi:MAG: YdcH family protein [Acetobacter sp.]